MVHRITLKLEGKEPLARGTGRIVYQHPKRSDAIIKVHQPLQKKPMHALRMFFRPERRRYANILNSFVEIEETAAIVARLGYLPTFTTQFLGFVDTDLGPGAMFEAVHDVSGQLAPHLKTHAWAHGFDAQIEAAIDVLWDQIAQARAVVSDPNITNVLVTSQALDGYHLKLVDGLGERTMIRLLRHSDWAYSRYVARGRQAMKAIYQQRASERSV